MSVLTLYQTGVIGYLFARGIVSGSTLAYLQYYTRYVEERGQGKKYRECVRELSMEFRVSETTIKKAIKVVKDA